MTEPHDATVWSRSRILARIKAILDPEEYRQLEDRLNGERPGAAAAWLEHVVDAAATLPLFAPPDDLSRSLRSMFDAVQQRQRVEATLVNDSRIERDLIGVRGDDGEGWTLSYSSGLGNILVDVWPDGERFDIEAQLMSVTASARFTLALIGTSEFTAASDRLGRASVAEVPSGGYELRIERHGVEVFTHIYLEPEQ